jgi:Outer membrane protein beta-barrel domain
MEDLMKRLRCPVTEIAVLTLAALVTLVAPRAEALAKPIEIGFGGGVSVPVSDAGDALRNGWHGTAIVRFNLPGLPLQLGAAASYERLKASTFDGSGRILSGLGNATVTLPFPGPVKPYVTAGLGAFNIKADPEDESVPVPDSETKFGIDAGLGLKFRLIGVHGFIEGKVENIYTDQGLNTNVTEHLDTQIIPVTFGVFL